MKNILQLPIPFLFMFFIISSCDKVNDPYNTDGGNGGGDTTVTKVRKVLIEDYTGHKCGNCPEAALTAQSIQATHGDQVVVMSVHSGFFAEPKASPYTYDFRTPPGNDYNTFFGNEAAGNPNGLVNRAGYPTSTHIKSHGNWGGIVDTIVTKAPDAWIEIKNNYNSTTRVLNTEVKTEFLKMMTGSYKLIVLLTEDSIVKAQLDYSKPVGQQNVVNYVHRHALRAAISSNSWGDQIVASSVAAGDTVVKSFTYTLPATFPATGGIAPNESKCSVVAFVYNATTYEVVQVEEKHIK